LELLILGILAADEYEAVTTGTDISTIEELYDLSTTLKGYCSKRRYLSVLKKLEAAGQIVARESYSGSRRGALIASNGESSNLLQGRVSMSGTFVRYSALPKYLN
jgi:hypothetical protein